MKTNGFVSLDADHQGELLVFLAKYHTFLTESYQNGGFTGEQYGEACYLLGNFEMRVMHDTLTNEALEIIEGWQSALQESKADDEFIQECLEMDASAFVQCDLEYEDDDAWFGEED